MVPPRRFERPANGLGNRCSILLSYGGNGGFRKRPIIQTLRLAHFTVFTFAVQLNKHEI